MYRRTVFLLLPVLLPACSDTGLPTGPGASFDSTLSAAEALVITDNVQIPVDLLVFVPCAAGGAGEEVQLSGRLHLVFHVTFDARGGLHIRSVAHPQGVSGLGTTTGTKYRVTGITQDQTTLAAAGTFTFVNNFRIIGAGPGNNYLVHENLHITINANGEFTAEHDNLRVECK